MKKLKKAFDNSNHFPSNCTQPGKCSHGDAEINQSLQPEGFTLAKVGRYGFPHHATCLAVDPIQKLLAIGTANGAIRICGKPGVEFHVNHETNASVTSLLFLVNQGGLVSVCDDASLHIWSIRQNEPAIIHSLNFKKERITAVHNPLSSQWLYAGTERGNIYMVNVETFRVSGYVISWNHVIDVSCKTNPGPVNEIRSNPEDESKLLLNFETGLCILWDLRTKKPHCSFKLNEASQYVTCATWDGEGKLLITGHWDGGICTWNYKNPKKPEERQVPHSTGRSSSKKGKDGMCCPVSKIAWVPSKPGELPIGIFTGGMAYGNKNKGLTIMRGRSKTLLLPEHVLDFQVLVSTPPGSEFPEPEALFVLLSREIVVYDLHETKTPSLPWFEVPYTFDIHESPVTCLQLYSECPNDLLSALHCVPKPPRNTANQSKNPWPIVGGREGEISQASSVIISGHADGSIKFWDATSNLLLPCYKISLSRLFEGKKDSNNGSHDNQHDYFEDPYAIQHLSFCPFGRVLAAACQSYFLAVFSFSSHENIIETVNLDVNFAIEVGEEVSGDSPTTTEPPSLHDSVDGENGSICSTSPSMISSSSYHPALKTLPIKWKYGFQPALVCQQTAYEPMPNITTVALSSGYGLVAFGSTIGVAIIDYIQKAIVMVIFNYELSVGGEWTDPLNNGHPPLTATVSDKEVVNGTPKKERFSRIQINDHAKLSKKTSSQGSGGSCGRKEEEDWALVSKKDDLLVSSGSVESISFAYSYTKKGGNLCCPCMWVGTSQGLTAAVLLNLPVAGEQRKLQPVLAQCAGAVVDSHYSVLKICHLDQCGNILLSPFLSWSDGRGTTTRQLQTSTSETTERRFVCVATEKSITVYQQPMLKVYSTVVDPVPEDSFIVRADSMVIESGNALGCLTTDGTLRIYSLPTLILLLDVECQFSLADYRLIRTFSFGKGGEAVFLGTATEIQRLAFTKSKSEHFADDHGCLFTICPLPEAKPKGFFQNFFGGAPSPLDREELFGEEHSGTSRKVADYIPGSGLPALRHNADTAAGAISKAKIALIERGEKLSELEDRTAQMSIKASSFASAAKALSDKYEKKKWYQL